MRSLEELEGQVPTIIAVGKGLPRRRPHGVITNEVLDGMMRNKRGEPYKAGTVDRMNRTARICLNNRYYVNPGVEAVSNLAARALRDAMRNGRINKEDIKAVYLGTSSGDFPGVSTVAISAAELGLSRETLGSNNTDACTGFVHALYRTTTDLSSPYGRGNIQAAVGADIISINLDMYDKNSILFGDGAGSVLMSMKEPVSPELGKVMGFAFDLQGQYANNLGVQAGGSRLPTSAKTVRDRQHSLRMDGEVVEPVAVESMVNTTRRALAEAKISVQDVDLFIPHQANGALIDQVAETLGLPMERVIKTISLYGNTSASSIPLGMEWAYRYGKLKRGMIIAGSGFGAGFNGGAFVTGNVQLPVLKEKKYF